MNGPMFICRSDMGRQDPPVPAADPVLRAEATSTPPTYNARWGYRTIDVERWERRRYGGLLRRLDRRVLERALVRALAGVPAGGRVLDAACGSAILASAIGRAGYRVLGADISPAMLGLAVRRLGVGAVRCEAERLPLRTACVDAVVCTRFLLHLPDELRPVVLRELGRVCTGPIVITISTEWTVKRVGRAIRAVFGGRRRTSTRWLSPVVLAGEAAAVGLEMRAVRRAAPFLSNALLVVLTRAPGTAMLA
jgi:SAM-dependent methyltransferase